MTPLLAAVLLTALQPRPAPAPQLSVPVPVRVVPFPGLDQPRTAGCLVLRSGLTLSAEAEGFGGFSDMSLAGPGERATFVSDAGAVMRARLVTDPAGDAVGLAGATLTGLTERDGSALGKRDGDAEGLAWTGTGFAVSLEGEDRVAAMSGAGVLGQTLYPAPGDEAVLGANSGFEALAALPDGRLLVVSEGKDEAGDALVRVGTLDEPLSGWAAARYRPAQGFNVTSADVDPATGDLFVLERAYSPWRGARMRVVRVPASQLGGEVLRGRQLTRMGFLEGVDNMEGLAAARTADGQLRLYLVSDDNFSAAQRTVVLTLGLAPGCEDGDAAQAPARGDPAPQEAVEAQEGDR